MKIFPWVKDPVARASQITAWNRDLADIGIQIQYMQDASETHFQTFTGVKEKSVLIAEFEADKMLIQAQIGMLNG